MSELQDTHYGFKKITNANWQKFDETTKLWCAITAAAKTNEDWIKFFSYAKLDPKVPEKIAKLLEVARGAMIYGWNFYPLLTLGVEQCYRLLDTGTRIRCNELGIPTKKKGGKGNTSFKENTDALMKHGIISKTEEIRWNAVRGLRNESSHPEQQSIFRPGQAQETLAVVVEILNDLFR
jgi:hypothetical protein